MPTPRNFGPRNLGPHEGGPRKSQIELPLALFALAGLVGVGIGLALTRSADVEPGLIVSPRGLDMGTVWGQTAYRHAFAVRNASDQPIRVAWIKSGCGCTTVEPRSFTLKARATQELVATLDFTDYAGSRFSVELLPQASHQPLGSRGTWTLRADVLENPIQLERSAIDFGDDVIAGEAPPEREIEVTLADGFSFDRLHATTKKNLGRAELTPIDARRGRLRVVPLSGMPAGEFEMTVRVELDVPATRADPFREIPVRGHVRDDIAAWPDEVNFAGVDLGETVREYVVLASHHGRDFEVERIETPESITVTLAEEQLVDGTRTFVIEQSATTEDHQEATVVFHIRRAGPRAGASADMTIRLPVSYYGIPAGPGG